MKKIIILIFFFLNIFNYSYGTIKIKIINNFKSINNISFDFKQNINDKSDNGNCIIKYPKKLYCSYNNFKKKIIVSNGKSLVIKNIVGKEYFLYPLKQTLLEFILDKELLLSKIEKLNAELVDDKYYLFSMEKSGNKINIFFDRNSYNLIGWQTEDIYQNLVITFIYNVIKNSKIDDNLFKLPKQH